MSQGFIASGNIVQIACRRGAQIRFQHDHGGFRQVVEQRRRGVGAEEERQVVFDAGRRQPFAHVAIDRAALHIDIEGAVPGILEAANGGGIERHFPRRQNANGIGLGNRALGIDIEGAQGVDFVIE